MLNKKDPCVCPILNQNATNIPGKGAGGVGKSKAIHGFSCFGYTLGVLTSPFLRGGLLEVFSRDAGGKGTTGCPTAFTQSYKKQREENFHFFPLFGLPAASASAVIFCLLMIWKEMGGRGGGVAEAANNPNPNQKRCRAEAEEASG